jgi:hypothetical protein
VSSVDVRRKLEFGDFLLLLYALVFVRQYAWTIPNDFAAWVVSIAVTLALWITFLRFKPLPDDGPTRLFWVTVALPLMIIYLLRAAIPDLSYDVLNHRLIQGERALRGPQFLPGDFFPNVFPFNPSSDMLTGMFRHLLGYRLGTVLNPLVLIWTGIILDKILRPLLERAGLRCLAVLLILFTEHIMFEVSTYMVDLLALPLILEATRLALAYRESHNQSWDLCWPAMLFGLALGLKLTNAAMMLPVMIVFALRVPSARRDKRLFADVAVAAILFVLPLLPHLIYIYRQTGNPFFPLYNDIFHSPYWPDARMGDGRWGPRSRGETFLWPLITLWMPRRLSELGVYAGRMTLGVFAAFFCILLPRLPRRVKWIALICLLSSFTWSAASGYVRYALFSEILGGLLTISLARHLRTHLKTWPRGLGVAVACLPIILILAQGVLSASYISRIEWSQRPISLQASAEELKWLGRDRNLLDYQSAEDRANFANVDAWIVSSVKTNGVEALLRPNVPMLEVNYNEYFVKPAARKLFANALQNLRGKRVFSLAFEEDVDSAVRSLQQRNLVAGNLSHLIIPFYSYRTRFHVALIEVLLPEGTGVARRPLGAPDITEIAGPLNDDAFLAELSVTNVPAVMKAGQRATINVEVMNASTSVWRAKPTNPPVYGINAADIWYRTDGKTMVTNMGGRSGIPRDLWPGEAATVQLPVKAPDVPGDYVLEIDLVQEAVVFFKQKGSPTWRTSIKVE